MLTITPLPLSAKYTITTQYSDSQQHWHNSHVIQLSHDMPIKSGFPPPAPYPAIQLYGHLCSVSSRRGGRLLLSVAQVSFRREKIPGRPNNNCDTVLRGFRWTSGVAFNELVILGDRWISWYAWQIRHSLANSLVMWPWVAGTLAGSNRR